MTMKSCNTGKVKVLATARHTKKNRGKNREKTNYKLPRQTLLTNLR